MAEATGELRAAGLRLEHRWVGPGPAAAPTLVLLHEGLGCVSTWRDFPERLAAATGCGALVYSRAGYGRSQSIALLPGCGHSPHRERPEETLAATERFVAGLLREE